MTKFFTNKINFFAKMSKSRIISIVIAIVIAIALITFTCVEWHQQGASVQSLVAAIAFYITIIAALWNVVDHHIKELEG